MKTFLKIAEYLANPYIAGMLFTVVVIVLLYGYIHFSEKWENGSFGKRVDQEMEFKE